MNKVYQVITDRIIEKLEKGTVPWRQPWAGPEHAPKNLVSGKEYRGINALILASAGYLNPWWVTFKQAKHRGAHVQRGEKGYPCIYWNTYTPDLESDGSDASKPRAFLHYYTLFNVEQCEDLEYPKIEVKEKHFSPIEACERLVNQMPSPPGIEHRLNQAFYRPAEDIVNMPKPERFDSREAYYSTLFHEFIHSTGHESRLARTGIADELVFGSEKYSREELIAEMGASYLCGHTGIENQIDNSAGYLAGWLRRVKGDNRLIVHAAAQAQKAADWILGNSGIADVVEHDEPYNGTGTDNVRMVPGRERASRLSCRSLRKRR